MKSVKGPLIAGTVCVAWVCWLVFSEINHNEWTDLPGQYAQYRQGRNDLLSQWITDNALAVMIKVSLGLLFASSVVSMLVSYFLSIKQFGKERFHAIFYPHLICNIIDFVAVICLFKFFGVFGYLTGYGFEKGNHFLELMLTKIQGIADSYIPTLMEFPYPLAIIASAIVVAAPAYMIHLAAHKSRLLWLAVHRCHHTAEILHPAGVGPFFFLQSLVYVAPSSALTAILSKLFYSEPLILESFFLGVLYLVSEKLNHSTVLYEFSYRNKLVRAVSCYFGNGAYHQMHHSSRPGDEAVNLGNDPFLFWDRVCGTYRSPTPQSPRIGLTNQPAIRLSPLRLLFGGMAQIAYELRKNKGFMTRARIIFGSSSYTPPVSKEFLKISADGLH